MSEFIHTRREDAIVCVAMSRPEKKNAITTAMYSDLAEAIGQAAFDDAVRVAVIHGDAGNFTAGNDLGDFLASPPEDDNAPVFRFLREISNFEKPLIAAVEGVAIGIGTSMLLHCDFVYAAADARFALPFVNLGVVPEAASSLLLPQIAGWQRTAELLMLGEPFSAGQAREAGLVNAVLDRSEVLPAAMKAARLLAAKPPQALRETKDRKSTRLNSSHT